MRLSLPEKCPNTEFFLIRIFPHSARIRENTDQKKLRLWTHFTQCICNVSRNYYNKSRILKLFAITCAQLSKVPLVIFASFALHQENMYLTDFCYFKKTWCSKKEVRKKTSLVSSAEFLFVDTVVKQCLIFLF